MARPSTTAARLRDDYCPFGGRPGHHTRLPSRAPLGRGEHTTQTQAKQAEARPGRRRLCGCVVLAFAIISTSCRKASDAPAAGVPQQGAEPAAVQAPADPAAAAKARSADNLRRLAEAMHQYHAKHGALPSAALCAKDGQPLLSWRVLVLPFLGAEELFREFQLDEPWDGPNNKRLLGRMPAVFASGAGGAAGGTDTRFQVFAGGLAPFAHRSLPGVGRGRELHSFRNGTSNTFLIVEAGEPVPWSKPADIPYARTTPDLKPETRLPSLEGPFSGGFLAAFAHKKVYWVEATIPEKDLHNFITPNVWIPPVRRAHIVPFVLRDARGEVLHQGKPASAWLDQLKSPDDAARRAAVEALYELNADDAAWLPALTRALQDKEIVLGSRRPDGPASDATRRPANAGSSVVAVAVSRMGDEGQRVLLDALAHPAPEVREEVAVVLSRAMMPGSGRPWPAWQDRAALLKIGPALQLVLREWMTNYPARALGVLGLLAPDAEWAVPLLRQVMKEPPDAPAFRGGAFGATPGKDFLAALVLTRYPGQAGEAVPFLLDSLKVHKPHDLGQHTSLGGTMGEQVYWAVRRLGPAAVGPLLPALRHESEVTRAMAVRLLAGQPPQPEKLLPRFQEALADKNFAVRQQALRALEPYGPAAVGPLLTALQGKDLGNPGLRHDLLEVLGRLGPPAAAAVPTLVEWTKRQDTSDQRLAAQALFRIERKADSVLPLLASGYPVWGDPMWMFPAVREFGPEARAALAAALEKLRAQATNSPDALYATNVLARLKDEGAYWADQLQQRDPPALLQALDALAQAGPQARAAAPRLRELLREELVPRVRAGAALALWRIEKDRDGALAAVRPVLENPNAPGPSGRVTAARLLWEVNRKPEEVLPLLLRDAMLTDSYLVTAPNSLEDFRDAAVLLGEMGPAARHLAPVLYEIFLHGRLEARPLGPGKPSPFAALAAALERLERP